MITAGRGQVYRRARGPTTISHLREVVEAVPRPREVVLEEGPLADGLWRNLAPQVDRITLCDPRRNHLMAKDSDPDDPLEAEKPAQSNATSPWRAQDGGGKPRRSLERAAGGVERAAGFTPALLGTGAGTLRRCIIRHRSTG